MTLNEMNPDYVPMTNEDHAAAERDANPTLGPCGCTDYHMADCPLMTGG
jgi:hypothetical protein